MSQAVETYLDRVMNYANLSEEKAFAVREELRDHLLEKIERLRARGASPEDAVFQAVQESGPPRIVGYGLRPRFPWIDIRSKGTARGFIAIGPRAVGVFAFGGAACGVFAFGGVAAGVVSMGGLVAAALFGWGGMGLSLGLVYAGLAIGLLAAGGVAVGIVAVGGMAAGLWAEGAMAISRYSEATAPASLHTLAAWMPTEWQLVGLSVILIAIFIPLLLMSQWAMFREQRRLERADPWLIG